MNTSNFKIAAFAVVASCLALPALAEKQHQSDAGSFDATYAKRDMQPIAENHVLLLSESTGTSTSKGELDDFSVSVREMVDLNRGEGPQLGYVIFSKGADRQIVKINGTISTTMKDSHPNVTMTGKYEVIDGTGNLSGAKGEGTFSGYFTAEDKYHIDWTGWRSRSEKSAKK